MKNLVCHVLCTEWLLKLMDIFIAVHDFMPFEIIFLFNHLKLKM